MNTAAQTDEKKRAEALKVEATTALPGPDLMPQIVDMAHRSLPGLLKGYFDVSLELLFKHSEHGEDNDLRDRFFKAVQSLRKHRAEVESEFIATFEQDLLAVARKPAEAGEISFANLSLVDESHLEEGLAVDSIANRATDRLTEELEAIHQVLAKLRQDEEFKEQDNPLSPKHIAKLLGTALDKLEVSGPVRMVLYAQFEKQVFDKIDPLFTEIDDHLIKHGLVSKQRSRQVNNPDSKGKERPAAEVEKTATTGGGEGKGGGDAEGKGDSKGAGGAGVSAIGTEMLDAIKALAQANAASGPAPTGPIAEPVQVATALSAIQPRAAQIPPGASPMAIGEKVKSQLGAVMQKLNGTDTPMGVDHLDSAMIDVVSMIFEKVLEDESLASKVKAPLARLQLPLLKVSIVEKALLEREDHPARVFINALASLGLNVNEDDDSENSPLLRYIEKTVVRVLLEFKDDVAYFESIGAEVERFAKAYQQKEEQAREQNARLRRRREQLETARELSDGLIDQAINGAEIPGLIRQLLNGPWRKVLVHAYMNGGETGDRWSDRSRLVKDLIWSVSTIEELDLLEQLKPKIPVIVRTLRAGLTDIKVAEDSINSIVSRLEPLQRKNLERLKSLQKASKMQVDKNMSDADRQLLESFSEIESTLASMDDMDSLMNSTPGQEAPMSEMMPELNNDDFFKQFADTPTDPRNAQLDPSNEPDDEFLTQARDLQIGQWLNIIDSDGKKVRAKVGWKSEMLGEYTFMNWKFKVMAEMSLYHLARELREGRANLIEDTPLIDRAMQLVTGLLKRKAQSSPEAQIA